MYQELQTCLRIADEMKDRYGVCVIFSGTFDYSDYIKLVMNEWMSD